MALGMDHLYTEYIQSIYRVYRVYTEYILTEYRNTIQYRKQNDHTRPIGFNLSSRCNKD